MSRVIRVGNGAGFWGDNLDAPRLLCESEQLDFLTLEYLAELTLSILAHLKSRDTQAGFVTDFPTVLRSLVPCLTQQSKLRIVTNAGGMNPLGCARQIAEILCQSGLNDVPIAAVSGDDIHHQLQDLMVAGETFSHFDSGKQPGETIRLMESANVYLGAQGIVDALQGGARIVITGRVADASLTLGPVISEFGWKWTDYDKLASASVAGHLIECGAQATGGMYSAIADNAKIVNLGYPVAEINEVGDVVVTKSKNTDGEVTPATLSEQLIYEIGDPQHYLTPDVDVDFSQVELRQVAPDRVEVRGARGNPPPSTYKVSMSYRDGYMAHGTLVVYGPHAAKRARECGEAILARMRRAGFSLSRSNIEILGAGGVLPGIRMDIGDDPANSREVVLRVAVQDPRKEAVDRFVREFSPLVGSGPPGVTGYTGPRIKPWPVLAYWPTTIQRDRIQPQVQVRTAQDWNSV